MAHAQVIATACHSEGLADILERVLDKGVVIAGDIKIKLCDIELLSIQIRLLIASVDKAREMGLTWWWQPPQQQQPPQLARGPPAAICRIFRRKPRGSGGQALRASDDDPPARRAEQRENTLSRTTTRKQKGLSDGQSAKGPNQAPAARRLQRRRTAAGRQLQFRRLPGKLGSVMEKLVDLAETGQNLRKTGELKGLDPQGKLRGVYGFSIKTGIGDQGEREVKIEPFGNIRRDPPAMPWSRTSASRWSTFTRRKITSWCWPRSRASARRTCNWSFPATV